MIRKTFPNKRIPCVHNRSQTTVSIRWLCVKDEIKKHFTRLAPLLMCASILNIRQENTIYER